MRGSSRPDRNFSLSAHLGEDGHNWFEFVLPQLRRAAPRVAARAIEFMQEPGDVVYIPAGGWYHQVISLTDTSSVSYNLVHNRNIQSVMKSVCRRTRRFRHISLSMCRSLRHLRPHWYNSTCCPLFLRDPSLFSPASPIEEQLMFPTSVSRTER